MNSPKAKSCSLLNDVLCTVINSINLYERALAFLQPQIGFLDGFIAQKIRGGIGHCDGAVFHDIAPVSHFKGKVGILLHQKNGGVVLGIDFLDNFKNLANNQGRKPQRWFIQQKQLRSCHKRS